MPESGVAPSPFSMLFPFAMMFLIFYVVVFRPQSKARKEHAQMLHNLGKHDEVVTNGGLIGTIVNVKPDILTLRIDENVRVDVERTAIARLLKSKSGGEAVAKQVS